MEDLREPLLGAAVGMKGVGKTYQTRLLINQYVLGNPAKGIAGRKVLILDANDEYSDIKAMYLEDVVKFTASNLVEVRRIRPYLKKGNSSVKMRLDDLKNALDALLDSFSGGLLLVEDINKYVSDSLKTDVMGAIATNRHRDQDIILHYQGIGRIGPKVWQNLNWLRFHKITEGVDRHKNKFEDKYELLKIVENIVNDNYFVKKDKRFYIYVDCENMKIPAVKKSDFRQACRQYIEEYPNLTINKQIKKRDQNGKQLYDWSKAMDMELERLEMMYL